MSNTTSAPMDGGRLTNDAGSWPCPGAPGQDGGPAHGGGPGPGYGADPHRPPPADPWGEGRSSLPPAVEWLLDNHYLALREGAQAGGP